MYICGDNTSGIFCFIIYVSQRSFVAIYCVSRFFHGNSLISKVSFTISEQTLKGARNTEFVDFRKVITLTFI